MRFTVKFQVDDTRDPDVLDIVDDLKNINKFAPSARDGLRIMHDIVINRSLDYLLSQELYDKYYTISGGAFRDLRDIANLLIAVETNDVEGIIELFPHLRQEVIRYAVSYTGLNFLSAAPMPRQQVLMNDEIESEQDVVPVEQPFDAEQALKNFLA